MKWIAPVLLFALLTSGCEKISTKTWVYYNETGCYDEWEVSKKDNNITIESLSVYLNNNGIEVFDIEINWANEKNKNEPCITGRRYEVQIKKKDVDIIKGLQFKELE